MEVYTIDDEEMSRIPNRPVEYEEELQSHLLKARGAEIGEVKMIYISQEGTADEEGGVFDILALDEHGDTVIVELKRGKTPRLVISQALEYASGIRTEEYDRLNDRFNSFRRQRGETADASLREAHADFFKLDDDSLDKQEFNNTIHLVVVAAEFDDVTLNMADLLRDHDLDVVCVQYQTFADDNTDLTLLTTESIRRPLALEPGGSTAPTATEELQKQFWDQLIKKINQRTDSNLYTESAKPRSYLPVRGTLPTDADIALGTNTVRGHIQVKLHIRDDGTDMWDQLRAHKSDIESELGEDLIWDADSARYEQIRLVRDGDIKTDQANWDDYHDWLITNWERFDDVFGTYLRRKG